MAVWGYARCSTNEEKQDLERQARELRDAGAAEIRMEFEHGDAATKAELDRLFGDMVPGDTLIVTEVSRLSRSTKQLCGIIERVKSSRWKLVILGSVTIDCTSGELDPMTAAFLQMAGVFSELELAMTRQRVKSGMANAKAKGKHIGRPKTDYERIPEKVKRYYPKYTTHVINMSEYARLCEVSRPTLYKYIGIMEGTNFTG